VHLFLYEQGEHRGPDVAAPRPWPAAPAPEAGPAAASELGRVGMSVLVSWMSSVHLIPSFWKIPIGT